MKVKNVLVPVAIASMTRSKVSLVQNGSRVSKAVEKTSTSTIMEMVQQQGVDKAEEGKTEVRKRKTLKLEATSNIKSSAAGKVWDLSTVCKESIFFPSVADFESWISANHAVEPAVWVKVAKMNKGIASVTCNEALMVALCYGWIDGIRKSLDETYFLQRYTPRRSKSNWSVVNKKYVAELVEAGRMKESGWKVINDAKEDGRWNKNN